MDDITLTEAEGAELEGGGKLAILHTEARSRTVDWEAAGVLDHLDTFGKARPDATPFTRAAEARQKARASREETVALMQADVHLSEAHLERLDGLMGARRELPSEVERLIALGVDVKGLSTTESLLARNVELLGMAQAEARIRSLTPAVVRDAYQAAVTRMDVNRGDQFFVRVVERARRHSPP